MSDNPMTYAGSGVNYDAMDPVKVNAQALGRGTAGNLLPFGYREVTWSRGESVYLMEADDHYLGFVVEGLGTKNLIADAMWQILGQQFYDKIGQDAVLMILNDMITLGVMPMVVGQYLAVGSDRAFANTERIGGLAVGWTKTCDESGATYGPGETPTLRDIIYPSAIDIAGASVGMIKPKDHLINPANLQENDIIVIFASSGVHANGLTMIRDLSEKVSLSELVDDGRMFGEAVLDPTINYVPLMKAILESGILPHYAINVTGHGWRKLMRAVEPFVYVIEHTPQPHPIFNFIQTRGNVSDSEMYANYNMGAGFALVLHPVDVVRVLALAQAHGIEAMIAGYLEKHGQDKKVIIEPLGLEFDGTTLGVR